MKPILNNKQQGVWKTHIGFISKDTNHNNKVYYKSCNGKKLLNNVNDVNNLSYFTNSFSEFNLRQDFSEFGAIIPKQPVLHKNKQAYCDKNSLNMPISINSHSKRIHKKKKFKQKVHFNEKLITTDPYCSAKQKNKSKNTLEITDKLSN